MVITDADIQHRPRWPSGAIDAARCRVLFGLPADELVVRFPDLPEVGYSDPIDAPDGSDTAVLVDDDTGAVVGIHVYPLLAGAAKAHPSWRSLAEPNPSPEVVAAFVAEVADLFDRYWTPAPPWEEQLANLRPVARPGDRRGAESS
jgi:hypothetical protein